MEKCLNSQTLNFLTIDWDYFIDASIKERDTYFPDGGSESISHNISDIVWASRYVDSIMYQKRVPTSKLLSDVKMRVGEYKKIRKVIKNLNPNTKIMVCESHAGAYSFAKDNSKGKKLNITNIDFHHDIYDFGHDSLDCGNWLRLLIEEGIVNSALWVMQEDSDTEGDKKFLDCIEKTIDFERVFALEYDFVLLCKSRVWSPPHLDKSFISLCKLIYQTLPNNIFQVGVNKDRYKSVESQVRLEEKVRGALMCSMLEGMKNDV